MFLSFVLLVQGLKTRPFVNIINLRLPLRWKLDIRSSRVLYYIDWWLLTDVSGRHICAIFEGKGA
jgi:hypothetical protein